MKKGNLLLKRCLTFVMAFALVFAMMPSVVRAEEPSSDTGYVLEVTVDAADDSVDVDNLHPGDSVTLTATLTYNGEKVTDLEEAGLYLWWWTDTWNDHTDCNSDAKYSNYDENSGYSLTATVTLPSEGDYCIVAELQDSSYADISVDTTIHTVFTVSEETSTGYKLSVSMDPESGLEAGQSAVLTATLTYDGKEITDLKEAGLYLWWWTDTWNDHTDCNSDAEYSNYGDNNGLSLSATVSFPSEGKYCIVAELQDSSYAAVTDESGNAITVYTEIEVAAPSGYKLTVTADTDSLEPGDSAEFTATLTYNGVEITDLKSAGLYLWWWTDSSNDHDGCNSNTTYSDYDNNSGRSLSATVTFPSSGSYCIVAELQDSSYADITDVNGDAVTVYTEVNIPVESDIEVQKVSGLSDDFIMGMDISTIVAEYNSGVKYYDFDGNELSTVTDFCKFLADDCGVTSVRVRIWNDPYDEDGNGYGAGNCDVVNAVTIANACAAAGLDMLVDFHYSDFWADPSRQLTPKAWTGYSVNEKAEALYNFTLESLKSIAATGVTISMVQVGNETTNEIADISNVEDMCTLFASGSAAVREFSEDQYGDEYAVRVAIHVSEPGKMVYWAGNLDTYGVDYDVLATSYYPFWHGSFDNLKAYMQEVMDTYGKEVLVAETSYVYTTEDTDGQANAVEGTTDLGSDEVYEVSVQGQAEAVRDVIAAVSEVGGLGVYYWEPAWITVGDTTGLTGDEYDDQVAANNEIWENYGSGWASSYATSYDWASVDSYGGSEWDNQAMFYPSGEPTAALHVYNYVKTGSYTTSLYVRSVTDPELTYEISDDATLILPETVDVVYSKTKVGTVAESVSWDEDEAAAVDLTKAGTYTVSGVVTLSQDCTDGTETMNATCYITVIEANLITDSDVAGFEKNVFTVDGDSAVAVTIPSNEDVLEGNYAAHWWNSNASETLASTISYEYGTLDAGYYTFEITGMGIENDGITALILDANGDVIAEGDTGYLYGWTLDSTLWTTATVTFYLAEATDVTLAVRIDSQGGGWGSVDSMYLHQHASPETVSNGDGTHSVVCGDCGMQLDGSEACTYKLSSTVDATCTAEGKNTYICSACGDSYTETITATGHTIVTDPAVAATYKSTGLTEGSHCSVCGEVIVAQEVIPALTYDYDNDGITESAYTSDSYDAYKTALEALQAAFADTDSYTEDEIEALIAEYEASKAALVKASGNTDDEDSDTETSDTSDSVKATAASTADSLMVYVFGIMILAAFAAIALCIWRKNKTVE